MRELRSGIFFFTFSLFVIGESLRAGLGTLMKPGPGFLSFCVGTSLLCFSLAFIQRGWAHRASQTLPLFPRRVILTLLSLLIYGLTLDILGFALATFLLVGTLLRLGQPRPWAILISMSVLVTLSAYVLFSYLLHIPFPRGFLGI
jgi:putative tricarboxylic transport membrane protein